MIVLDSAALVDLLLDYPPASWVLAQMADEMLVAPAHQPAEVLSAVARLVRSGDLPAPSAQAALAELADLEQDLVRPTRGHLERALDLHAQVRVLDGLYVALAEERRCALVTTDRRLARAAAGLSVDIRTPE